MNNRTEAKLTDLSGMQKAIDEILKQAWERGRKYGQNEAKTDKKEETMTPNKNYIDERGNYHNVENLTLAQIYDKGVEEGYRIAKMEQEEKHNDR